MKFLISGYYGFDNIGDEAILAVLAGELQQAFPKTELVVLSQRPGETERDHKIRAINRWNLKEIWQELQTTSLFISGGGGLIQDSTSRRSALYYLGLMGLASKFCPVVVMGQGIGPLRSPFVQASAKKIFRKVELAFLRDDSSVDLMKTAGLPDSQIIRGSDLTLLRWPAWAALRDLTASEERSVPRHIGVSLAGQVPHELKQALARQLDQIYERLNLRAMLIAFHLRQDRKPLEEVAALMRWPALVIGPSAAQPNELMECVGQTRYMLGMRLHSMIFSLLAARPFLCIEGDPKLGRFAQQVTQWGGPEILNWSPAQIASGEMNLTQQIELLEASYESQQLQLQQAGEALFALTQTAMKKTCDAIRPLLAACTEKSTR